MNKLIKVLLFSIPLPSKAFQSPAVQKSFPDASFSLFLVAEGCGSQSSAYRRSDVWCVLIGLLASHGADAPITAHHAEGRWNRIHSHGCLSQLQISFLSFARPEIGWVFSFINYGVGPLSFLSLSLLHFSRRRKGLLCREIWRWTIVDFFVPWSSRSMDWFFSVFLRRKLHG